MSRLWLNLLIINMLLMGFVVGICLTRYRIRAICYEIIEREGIIHVHMHIYICERESERGREGDNSLYREEESEIERCR